MHPGTAHCRPCEKRRNNLKNQIILNNRNIQNIQSNQKKSFNLAELLAQKKQGSCHRRGGDPAVCCGQRGLLLKDFYYLSLIPLAGLVLLLFITRFETGLLSMALLTPFAINMALMPKMELSMPVEPMMILFTLMFFFRVLVARNYDTRLLRHPVSILLLASMGWMLVTTCTSSMPFVSFKYWLARLWFVVPFFFAAAQIFRNKTRIRQFFWCYAIGLIAVICLATAKTVGNFSDLQTLHRVMKPFYNDHTAYGCVIALMLPATFYFLFSRASKGWSRLLSFAIMALLLVGLFFSYCRAAWLSVLGAIGVYVLIRMGMKVKWMVLLFGLGVGVFFVYQSDVLYKLGKNHQDSSYDLAGQIKSISNISTDASNLERLNRWASALRMWKENPMLGCGPGTARISHCQGQTGGRHGIGLHPEPADLLHTRRVQQLPRHRQAVGAFLGFHRRGGGLGCL